MFQSPLPSEPAQGTTDAVCSGQQLIYGVVGRQNNIAESTDGYGRLHLSAMIENRRPQRSHTSRDILVRDRVSTLTSGVDPRPQATCGDASALADELSDQSIPFTGWQVREQRQRCAAHVKGKRVAQAHREPSDVRAFNALDTDRAVSTRKVQKGRGAGGVPQSHEVRTRDRANVQPFFERGTDPQAFESEPEEASLRGGFHPADRLQIREQAIDRADRLTGLLRDLSSRYLSTSCKHIEYGSCLGKKVKARLLALYFFGGVSHPVDNT
jgi:hypothetical protein